MTLAWLRPLKRWPPTPSNYCATTSANASPSLAWPARNPGRAGLISPCPNDRPPSVRFPPAQKGTVATASGAGSHDRRAPLPQQGQGQRQGQDQSGEHAQLDEQRLWLGQRL